MALIVCPECGQSVSDQAAACPACAHPIASRSAVRAEAAAVRPEKTYLSAGYVNITSTRASFGSNTYAVANISSVNTIIDQFPRQIPIVGAAIFGVAALLTNHTWYLYLVGVACLAIAFLGKNTLVLIITGGGGESRAFATKDVKFFTAVREAIQAAIVERG